MLNNPHFYNRTIRKIVVAFGTIFNEIFIVRYNKAGTQAFEKIKVPLSYGAKEKYLTRITSDPNLTKSVQTVVPRISFELTSLSYDPSRKQQTTLQNFAQTADGKLRTQYAPVPYDFSFSLSFYVRNTEDGTQILEQILPFFTPDFTVTVDFIPEMSQKYDMPVILNSVNSTTDYEGDMMSTRLITWDLEFTVKSFIWPLISLPNGLIGAFSNTANSFGSVQANIFIEEQSRIGQKVIVDYANGSNFFSDTETVRVREKDIKGKIQYFSNNSTGVLIISDLNKLLEPNDVIVGDFTNSHYTVQSVDIEPIKVVTKFIQAKPVNANIDDEFGFAESTINFPNTL